MHILNCTMSKSWGSTVLMGTAVVALVFLGSFTYMYAQDIWDVLETAQGGDMKVLVDLARAIRVLDENVTRIENADNYSTSSADEIQCSDALGQSKKGESILRFKELCQADSDVDFVFTRLDSVRGDKEVKQKRKELVLLNKRLAARIDVLKMELVQ